jgi:hypothetical protein
MPSFASRLLHRVDDSGDRRHCAESSTFNGVTPSACAVIVSVCRFGRQSTAICRAKGFAAAIEALAVDGRAAL